MLRDFILLSFFTVTMLILLSTTTRTRIISSNLWSYFDWLLLYRCRINVIIFIRRIIAARCIYLRFVCPHAAKISFLFAPFTYLLRLPLFHWNIGMAKEI